MIARFSLCLLAVAAVAEPEFQDSPALTTIWQATSSGETDRLVDVYVQGHELALTRSGDGRGPLFWAYEFKNVDALALLTHLEADEEGEDLDGKRPREFFPDGPDLLAEFVSEAEAKVDEVAGLLKEREDEFASYQSDTAEDAYGDDVYDEGSENAGRDEIDYADEDEDEEFDESEVPSDAARRLEELRARAKDEV